MAKTIVLVDSSYYNFLRFTATKSWLEWSEERREAAEDLAWLENPTFMSTFEKNWFENLCKICKKFKVTESDIIFARDGKNVWRYKLFPAYKQHRQNEEGEETDPHALGPVFKHINDNFHPQIVEKGASIVFVDTAEADDIIAIAVEYINTCFSNARIVIITGDHDLLQIRGAEIYSLKGGIKEITSAIPQEAMLLKVIGGDPSDNIPAIFKGCGKKTAAKLASDPNELKTALQKHGREQYDLNQTLVNFDNIPQVVREEIEVKLDEIFSNV